MPLIPGTELNDTQRAEVFQVFQQRETIENRDTFARALGLCIHCREPWSGCMGRCLLHWDTDANWIGMRAFHFKRKTHGGGLASRKPCYTMDEYARKDGKLAVTPDMKHARDPDEDPAYERAATRARGNDFEDTGGKDWT